MGDPGRIRRVAWAAALGDPDRMRESQVGLARGGGGGASRRGGGRRCLSAALAGGRVGRWEVCLRRDGGGDYFVFIMWEIEEDFM
jgi:hypothetical protein